MRATCLPIAILALSGTGSSGCSGEADGSPSESQTDPAPIQRRNALYEYSAEAVYDDCSPPAFTGDFGAVIISSKHGQEMLGINIPVVVEPQPYEWFTRQDIIIGETPVTRVTPAGLYGNCSAATMTTTFSLLSVTDKEILVDWDESWIGFTDCGAELSPIPGDCTSKRLFRYTWLKNCAATTAELDLIHPTDCE